MPEPEPNTVRHELHVLLDHIPDNDVPIARNFLRSLVDPVALSLLTASMDDESETDEERAAVEAARSERSGRQERATLTWTGLTAASRSGMPRLRSLSETRQTTIRFQLARRFSSLSSAWCSSDFMYV
jgi:hypothetical protein